MKIFKKILFWVGLGVAVAGGLCGGASPMQGGGAGGAAISITGLAFVVASKGAWD